MNGESTTRQETSLLRDIVYVVFKRKAMLITLTVVGVAIIAYGFMTAVPVYEATARVMIKRVHQGYVMPSETRQVLKRAEVINSELSIITSSTVAEVVVDELGLASPEDRGRVIHDLQRRIRAQDQPESDIIDITYRNTDPEMAAAVVNSALDAYLEIRKSVALNYDAVKYLDAQATRTRALRDSVARELATFSGERGQLALGRLGEQRMGLQDRFANELAGATSRIQYREEQLDMVRDWLDSGADPANIPTYMPGGEVYQMSSVEQTKVQLTSLELELAAVRARYTEDHPTVLALERRIAATREILRTEVEQALERQQMRLDGWKAERRAIIDMLNDLHREDVDISSDEYTIRLLEQDLSIHADLYAIVMDRREQFRITAATDPNLLNVGIVARAAVPVEPTPQAVNMTVVVGLFTIVFGILLVLAVEKADSSLERREDVQQTLGLKVLATIPERT